MRLQYWREVVIYLAKEGDGKLEANLKEITVKEELFKEVNVFMNDVEIDGIQALRVTKDPVILGEDEATYAKLVDSEFQDGIIEVKVLSRLLSDAPDHARGFIGVAFRIDENDDTFESIYIRPTNGSCEIQLRRNRAVQYFSYPEFKYDRSRETNPGEYETYADIDLNQWIDMKIEVESDKAKLYLNGQENPTLIVNDMKHGADKKGALGLWVDIGTEGFFRDLKFTSNK